MFKYILASLAILAILVGDRISWAEGPAYQPGTSCDSINYTSIGSVTEVEPYDGTAVDLRITVDNSGAAPVRCTFGNAFGSTPAKPTTSSGYEITSTSPFDSFPYVPASADTWCIAESGSPHISILRCHR